MTYTFDYFVGKMTCLNCGVTSKADESTDMQTKICEVRHLMPYGVGDFLPCDYNNLRDNGYILVNSPKNKESYSLLDFWDCINCRTAFNCAQIVIENEVIASVEAVELNIETINSCNYISEDCVYLGWRIVDGLAIKSDI